MDSDIINDPSHERSIQAWLTKESVFSSLFVDVCCRLPYSELWRLIINRWLREANIDLYPTDLIRAILTQINILGRLQSPDSSLSTAKLRALAHGVDMNHESGRCMFFTLELLKTRCRRKEMICEDERALFWTCCRELVQQRFHIRVLRDTPLERLLGNSAYNTVQYDDTGDLFNSAAVIPVRETTIDVVNSYRRYVGLEMETVCLWPLRHIETIIIPMLQTRIDDSKAKESTSQSQSQLQSSTPERQLIWFFKYAGDIYRWMCEENDDKLALPKRDEYLQTSQKYYNRAMDTADRHLSPADELRCALGLNYAVFVYDVLEQKQSGIEIAQRFLKNATEAMSENRSVGSDNVVQILTLLEDNITMWTAVDNDDE